MILLPAEFDASGFRHQQVWRSEKAAIYLRSRIGGKARHFELVRPLRTTKHCMEGKWVQGELREIYPSAEQWGERAWTFPTLDAAMAKATSRGLLD